MPNINEKDIGVMTDTVSCSYKDSERNWWGISLCRGQKQAGSSYSWSYTLSRENCPTVDFLPVIDGDFLVCGEDVPDLDKVMKEICGKFVMFMVGFACSNELEF